MRYYNNYFAKEVSCLESIDQLLESLNGEQYKHQHAIINSGPRQANIHVEFNQNGAISNYKYQIPEDGIVDDSVAFNYYPNGTLKEIQSYEIKIFEDPETDENLEKMTLEAVYTFDEKQNLIQSAKFGSLNTSVYSDEVEIEYYTYFGDRVIGDYGGITSCSMGHVYGNTEYLILEGNVEVVNEFDNLPMIEYALERENNETRLLYKNSGRENYIWRYFTQNGRIEYYQEDSDNMRIDLSYDDRGNLIASTKHRVSRNGLLPYTKAVVEYDKQNRPTTYTYYVYKRDESVNNTRTYTFTWDAQ